MTAAIHAGILTAFEEDRAMITAQQKNLLLDPDFRMAPLTVDGGLGQFRWVVQKMIKEEATARQDGAAATTA